MKAKDPNGRMCTDDGAMPEHCAYTNTWILQSLLVTAAFVALANKAACCIFKILSYCTLS
jgi:hypothetical protein